MPFFQKSAFSTRDTADDCADVLLVHESNEFCNVFYSLDNVILRGDSQTLEFKFHKFYHNFTH